MFITWNRWILIEQVLVPGELKRNPDKDKSSGIDLARYVREVFVAQDSYRFVLGFTRCGSPAAIRIRPARKDHI